MDPSLMSDWEHEKRSRILVNPCADCRHNEQMHNGFNISTLEQSACLASVWVTDPVLGDDMDMCRCRSFKWDESLSS
jgi:hypothetical protein